MTINIISMYNIVLNSQVSPKNFSFKNWISLINIIRIRIIKNINPNTLPPIKAIINANASKNGSPTTLSMIIMIIINIDPIIERGV